MGKSGGSSTTLYDYYATMAGGLCAGPVDELVGILLNSQKVWPPGGTAWFVGLACAPGVLYVFDAQVWTCTTAHTASLANAPGSGLEGWAEYTYARGSGEDSTNFTLVQDDGTHLGTLTLYWGTQTQTTDSLLQAANNDGGIAGNLGSGDTHPSYKGLCYFVIKDFLLGEEVQSGPNLEFVLRRKPDQSVVTGAPALISDGQANIAAILAELFTSDNCLGLPVASLDSASFNTVAAWLDTNAANYAASVLLDTTDSVRSVLDKLTAMFDGYVRFNADMKLIELGVYKHGQTPAAGTYITVTSDLLTKAPQFKVTSWQGTYSRATVRYNSRQLDYQQTSVQCDDARAYFILGAARDQALDRPFIAREGQALFHGRETLRVIGHAQTTGEIEVRREFGRTVRAGDFILVDVDLEPAVSSIYQFFRVTQRKIPPTGPVTLQLLADNTLAPVPWTSPSPVIPPATAVVPALTNYRVLEVPTILSGDPGAITVLALRSSNLMVGCELFFDTDPAGTFSTLGTFPIYAAQGSLANPVATSDATLLVNVDTSQVDADYFTQQYTANDAANDTMLLFLVAVVPSGSDAGQVQESAGLQIMEICSVSSQTLSAPGQYTISVLRGRKNTSPTAFATSNTEVWLIPANVMKFFNAVMFDTIRANRLAGTTPAYAQFRFCPFNSVAELPLSDAVSHAFRFPLNSSTAPSLTLTSPAGFTITTTPAQYPYILNVAGTWTAPDGDMVEVEVLLRLSTDTSDRVISDVLMSPRGSATFNVNVQFDGPGSYLVKLIARDLTSYQTEKDIVVTLGGSGPRCASVVAFDSAGTQIINPDYSLALKTVNGTTAYAVTSQQFLQSGPLTLKCSTPGSTINFQMGFSLVNGSVQYGPAVTRAYVDGACQPVFVLFQSSNNYNDIFLVAWATAPGFAAGYKTFFTLYAF